ncbi:CBS domain-containing protein [Streptomyces sp. AM8-1-1]|uniref:CBS domain-containing protein n=1 Tax=Streptomyces sp. AM8-1-1 TaxID=3075825 RepID=UPI0028C3EB35|nr:CBS domain-containing protein [Streptomyces sp. AM8-1-1]WNO70275.1 CBS domain-containing protein [Streptomyces sp. AM8-1-1]
MKHTKVGTVMVSDVITAEADTGFKEVARLLGDNRISGLPVVDDDEKVLGVISETDLMLRQAAAVPGEPEHRRRRIMTRAARTHDDKERAETAGALMSIPAVTVHADETIAAAARTMAQRHLERLPVIDEEERLVGIVTRREILQVFLRRDEDIRREVVQEVIENALWLAPHAIDVHVQDGVVTLKGEVERRSEQPIALHLTRQVDGVVSVVDELTYRLDDRHLPPAEQALHGIGDQWLRKL